MHRGSENGQATVELVALLPVIVLVVAMVWQAAIAGQAVWLAGSAARAAARASAVGADARAAARKSVPRRLWRGLRVHAERKGAVSVTLRVPAVTGGARLGTVTARARFAPQTP
jgi:hypothetical protein